MNEPLDLLKAEIAELEQEIKDFNPSDYFSEDNFKDYLNSLDEPVVIFGVSFDKGTILREMDYSAFKEMYHNHLDGLQQEGMPELQKLEDRLGEVKAELEDLLDNEE